jgi:hypothetical protein
MASAKYQSRWESTSKNEAGAPQLGIWKEYAEDWNRTSDTSIFSAVLYRLSYLGVGQPCSDRTLIITVRLMAPQVRKPPGGSLERFVRRVQGYDRPFVWQTS